MNLSFQRTIERMKISFKGKSKEKIYIEDGKDFNFYITNNYCCIEIEETVLFISNIVKLPDKIYNKETI